MPAKGQLKQTSPNFYLNYNIYKYIFPYVCKRVSNGQYM